MRAPDSAYIYTGVCAAQFSSVRVIPMPQCRIEKDPYHVHLNGEGEHSHYQCLSLECVRVCVYIYIMHVFSEFAS